MSTNHRTSSTTTISRRARTLLLSSGLVFGATAIAACGSQGEVDTGRPARSTESKVAGVHDLPAPRAAVSYAPSRDEGPLSHRIESEYVAALPAHGPVVAPNRSDGPLAHRAEQPTASEVLTEQQDEDDKGDKDGKGATVAPNRANGPKLHQD